MFGVAVVVAVGVDDDDEEPAVCTRKRLLPSPLSTLAMTCPSARLAGGVEASRESARICRLETGMVGTQ